MIKARYYVRTAEITFLPANELVGRMEHGVLQSTIRLSPRKAAASDSIGLPTITLTVLGEEAIGQFGPGQEFILTLAPVED